MIQMECIALTGIHKIILEELKKGTPRTVELTSAHNVISLGKVEPGQQIFLTQIECEDLNVGDAGIIVEVMSITIAMKHILGINPGQYYMEKERMSARIKVRYIANSTIRSTVVTCCLTEPHRVDVVRPKIYRAG